MAKQPQRPFDKAKGAFERFRGPVHTYTGTKVCGAYDEGEGGVLIPCSQLVDWKKEYAQGSPKDIDGPYHVIGTCRGSSAHNVERYGYWSQPEGTPGPPGAMQMAPISPPEEQGG